MAPVHNESHNVKDFAAEIDRVLSQSDLTWSLVLVDDGSTDDSWDQIATLSEANANVKGVRLSKNFGKEAALFAGLSVAEGDASVTIDSDLQHPPALILEMLKQANAGFDLVIAKKTSRPDQGRFVRLGAHMWSTLFEFMTDHEVRNTTDFRWMSRRLRKLVVQNCHPRAFFRFESSAFGYPSTFVLFDPVSRVHGASRYSPAKLARLAIHSIIASSTKPLQAVTAAAFAFLSASVALAAVTITRWIDGTAATGFTTVILLMLTIGGLTLLALGLIGEYLSDVVEMTRRRPMFVIDDEESS